MLEIVSGEEGLGRDFGECLAWEGNVLGEGDVVLPVI